MRRNNLKKIIKEEPKEIKIPNWLDKNKFKEMLIIIDSNKFGHINKIGDFKYIDIKDLVDNIKDNTISEIDAKKRLNTLNIIKNSEIKHKRFMFHDLSDIILTDKTLMSSKDENENENENKNENENENENENKNENENDHETINQNKIIKEKKMIF